MSRKQSAFTLVELMVSTAILTLMMVILLQMTSQTANTWRYGAAKAEQFSEARKAFETMTRRIGEATLNTYWDYYVPPKDETKPGDLGGLKIPTSYVRQSDLRFRVVQMSDPNYSAGSVYHPTQGIFFQAPVGMVEDADSELARLDDLLNSWGYFVEVEDTTRVPAFLEKGYPARLRSRLMEFRQPAEEFDLYTKLDKKIKQTKAGDIPDRDPHIQANGIVTPQEDDGWFLDPINLPSKNSKRPVRVLAENVLALVILPRLSPADERERSRPENNIKKDRIPLAPNFSYHSKQLTNHVPDANYKLNIDAEINPKNQLPPVVQIAMIAIDETTAQRLAEANKSAPDMGMAELLKDLDGEPLFKEASKLETSGTTKGDLQKLEESLVEKKLSYRLFSTNVAIRGAKWSRAQVQ